MLSEVINLDYYMLYSGSRHFRKSVEDFGL